MFLLTCVSYADEICRCYVRSNQMCVVLAAVLWMVQDGCCDVGGMRWVPTPGPLTSGDHHQWPRVHTRALTIMIPVIVTSSILGSHYLAFSSLALDRTIQLAKYVLTSSIPQVTANTSHSSNPPLAGVDQGGSSVNIWRYEELCQDKQNPSIYIYLSKQISTFTSQDECCLLQSIRGLRG